MSPVRHLSNSVACTTCRGMRRLFAFILLAFALALSSGPAFAVPRADCPMAASDMQGAHQDMDCCAAACAPECATVCPNGVMPLPESPATAAVRSQTVAVWVAVALPSADLIGADPPPRTTFS